MIKHICLLFVLLQVISLGSSTLTHLGKGYYLSGVQLEFIRAYAVCKRNGLILATERNEQESKLLNDTIRAAGQTERNYWLGGINETRGDLSPVWTWLDSNEDIIYNNWLSGWPKGDDYNCLSKSPLSGYNSGQWMSLSCGDKHWFICQGV